MRQTAAKRGRLRLAALAGIVLATTLTLGSPVANFGGTEAAAACSTFDRNVIVEMKDGMWEVKGSYNIRYNGCTGWSLLNRTCTKKAWFPYSVSVVWCGAFVSGRSLDLGWNADVGSGGRVQTCWARRWAYGPVTGPSVSPTTRSGCG